ncbi:MAG: hypothetical protein HYS07_04750 [Chlamydiae bacterium]|nr:hypothetical protein [Chlamydiota bacterium]MBI3276199.1 hypothetical protein [Chlamydiota bacterium]
MEEKKIWVNGEPFSISGYHDYHCERFHWTLEKLKMMGASKILEVGAHPWGMTAQMIDTPGFEICATVSAEEMTDWPDDIGVHVHPYHLRTESGNEARFNNYSANVERTIFDIQEKPDTILACEIVEHLVRSPHIMFLNFNRWLPVSGKLIVTTPNGAQFSNPLRRKTVTPNYRCNIYERHQYVFTQDGLVDLIELCGFKILETGYCDVIKRQGPSKVYGWLGALPWQYFQDKFKKTIYVIAEKEKTVSETERCPTVYDVRGRWEFVKRES